MYRDGSVESYVPYERLAVPRGALLAATAGECGVCLCENILLDNYYPIIYSQTAYWNYVKSYAAFRGF